MCHSTYPCACDCEAEVFGTEWEPLPRTASCRRPISGDASALYLQRHTQRHTHTHTSKVSKVRTPADRKVRTSADRKVRTAADRKVRTAADRKVRTAADRRHSVPGRGVGVDLRGPTVAGHAVLGPTGDARGPPAGQSRRSTSTVTAPSWRSSRSGKLEAWMMRFNREQCGLKGTATPNRSM